MHTCSFIFLWIHFLYLSNASIQKSVALQPIDNASFLADNATIVAKEPIASIQKSVALQPIDNAIFLADNAAIVAKDPVTLIVVPVLVSILGTMFATALTRIMDDTAGVGGLTDGVSFQITNYLNRDLGDFVVTTSWGVPGANPNENSILPNTHGNVYTKKVSQAGTAGVFSFRTMDDTLADRIYLFVVWSTYGATAARVGMKNWYGLGICKHDEEVHWPGSGDNNKIKCEEIHKKKTNGARWDALYHDAPADEKWITYSKKVEDGIIRDFPKKLGNTVRKKYTMYMQSADGNTKDVGIFVIPGVCTDSKWAPGSNRKEILSRAFSYVCTDDPTLFTAGPDRRDRCSCTNPPNPPL